MSLKQSIVIVNEFTTKTAKGGTRGGTPGDYVLRYMSRNGAVEDLTPVRKDTENFILRYMARDEAVDDAVSIEDLKDNMREIQGSGGVAFGYGDFSLSDEKLKAAAEDIQRNFDSGKTVMKTVLSFDEEYLRERGIIEPDFYPEQEGDYRGNIDQMKLRFAIMNGLDKLSKKYKDLQYIGVIQVDTKHVHCHLAMVDRGSGTITKDGTQRGKISDNAKNIIRRGIDTYLDEHQTIKMMAANIDYDKRNTLCFIKKYTHKAMDERGLSQFLLACLPKDKNLWTANSNSKEMRKANSIVREYVQELLSKPDSGYDDALKRVEEYASARVNREGLTRQDYVALYNKGHEKIIREGMNCVYSVLKQIPDKEFDTRTPMLETMALPYEDMASQASSDPMIEFGFKLRSYKSRLDYHKNERRKYHEAAKDYEDRERRGEADVASRPLYDFLKEEEEYNDKLFAKYKHFLNFIPPEDTYQEEFDDLLRYQKRVTNVRRMTQDSSMKAMTEKNAEAYGRSVYDEEGGGYVVTMPQALRDRLEAMEREFSNMQDEFAMKLEDYGMRLDKDEMVIHNEPKYDFDDVKALDLHHLTYDFPYDFSISDENAAKFVKAADERYEAFEKARKYLVESGQEITLDSLPVDDIMIQQSVADKFRKETVLHTQREVTEEQRQMTRTVSIDYKRYDEQEEDIKLFIKNTVNTLQFE